MQVYFDNAATTQVCPQARSKMDEVTERLYGNPSSLHTMGMESEAVLKRARGQVAGLLGVPEECIYFTSGGTESNNTAIFGAVYRNARKRKTILTTSVEHPSVAAPFHVLREQGFSLRTVPVTRDGVIDLKKLEEMADDQVAFASIMRVNNETGCIMPVNEAAEILRKKSPAALIHCDMVQAFGKLPLPDVDFASLSSHKIHGPKGSGALYVRQGVHLQPLLYGGGQEKDLRPGTQNMPGIAGFGEAAEQVDAAAEASHAAQLRGEMEKLLTNSIDNIQINGHHTIPQILNVSFHGTKSEVLLHLLESRGIMVSSGSACSSNKPAPSHVLLEMGLDRKSVDAAVRFSFSRYNTLEEIRYCVDVLKNELPVLRRMMR